GAGQVIQLLRLGRHRRLVRARSHVVGKAIPGQVQRVDGSNHIGRVKARVRVRSILLVDSELDRLRYAIGKIRASAVLECQVLATVGGIRVGVVVLDEA